MKIYIAMLRYKSRGRPPIETASVPVSIQLPPRVVLGVVETEPTTRGQTAASSYKPAKLSNGLRTNAPPHIVTGTRIVVSTEDASYVERAKD
jgi:elongation factor P